jgi:hypothetical protein
MCEADIAMLAVNGQPMQKDPEDPISTNKLAIVALGVVVLFCNCSYKKV